MVLIVQCYNVIGLKENKQITNTLCEQYEQSRDFLIWCTYVLKDSRLPSISINILLKKQMKFINLLSIYTHFIIN